LRQEVADGSVPSSDRQQNVTATALRQAENAHVDYRFRDVIANPSQDRRRTTHDPSFVVDYAGNVLDDGASRPQYFDGAGRAKVEQIPRIVAACRIVQV
jgi:hypothetical protein